MHAVATDVPQQFAVADRAVVDGRGVGFGQAVGAVHRTVVEHTVREAEDVAGFVVENLAGASQDNLLVAGFARAAPELGVIAAQAVDADALFRAGHAEHEVQVARP